MAYSIDSTVRGTATNTTSVRRPTRSRPSPLRVRWYKRWLALMVILALLFAACGSDGSSSFSGDDSDAVDSASDAASDAPRVAQEESEPSASVATTNPEQGSALASGGQAQSVQVDPAELGRDIIFTADLTVAVDDVAAARSEAANVIGRFGGLVFGEISSSEQSVRSTVTFRVPPENFQAALNALGDIGELRNQFISAEDVTNRVTDLESRITTAGASVARLRALIEGADTVEILAQLEGELLERETSLELLRGQLRQTRDLVDLATIVLTLTETFTAPELDVTINAYPGHDGGASCPGTGGHTAVEDEPTTLCFELTNFGDTPLAQIELNDPALGRSTEDFILVAGSLEEPLQPGGAIILALEEQPERRLRTRTQIRAVPVSPAGDEIEARPLSQIRSFELSVSEKEGIPTFFDGLRGGWNVLKAIVLGLLAVLGALLPFIWVIPLVWFGMRWTQRRNDAKAKENEARRATEVAEMAQQRRDRLTGEPLAAQEATGEAAESVTPPPPRID